MKEKESLKDCRYVVCNGDVSKRATRGRRGGLPQLAVSKVVDGDEVGGGSVAQHPEELN